MNPALLLSAALACTSALAFAPSQAPVPDDQKDKSAADSSQPIDLDKIHGPVYVIQDPSTGTTYILVPKADDAKDEPSQAPAEAYSPVRGVTYWA